MGVGRRPTGGGKQGSINGFGSSPGLVQSVGPRLVVRTSRMGHATHAAMVVAVLPSLPGTLPCRPAWKLPPARFTRCSAGQQLRCANPPFAVELSAGLPGRDQAEA